MSSRLLIRRVSTGLVLVAAAATALASQAVPFAAPTPQVVSATTSSALRVPLALLLVLAMVLGAAWLMRRATGMTQGSAQRMQVIAQLQLGAREKAVMIRVSGQDVLLGIAPGSVRLLLATASSAESPNAADAVTGGTGANALKDSFKDILRRSLGR
jgi:flagellar protein FliO/FliZ